MNIQTEISEFRKTIYELNKIIDAAPNEPTNDIGTLCDALVLLNLAKRDLGIAYDSLSKIVSDALGESALFNANNGATIEKKHAYDRKGWQHKELAGVVADKIVKMSVNMDTGEFEITPEESIVKLLDYVQPSYWRTTELTKIGVNADNYCETGDLKTSIIVRKGNAE